MWRQSCAQLLIFSILTGTFIAPALEAQSRAGARRVSPGTDRYQGAVRDAVRERARDQIRDEARDRAREAAAYRAGRASGYHTGAMAGAIRNEIRHEARRRYYRGMLIYRPHGQWYPGFGYHRHDNDAWKWIAFTAITLKVLDNLNEAAQRRHEDAQIRATTAAIGVAQRWEDGGYRGSVTAVRERYEDGLQCREFRQTVEIGGKSEDAYGTACLQPDGSWKIRP